VTGGELRHVDTAACTDAPFPGLALSSIEFKIQTSLYILFPVKLPVAAVAGRFPP
jgi:hypothetical protein